MDIESIRKGKKDPEVLKKQLKQIGVKVRRQVGKDYILFPLLTGPAAIETAKANALANLTRNLWSYMIIFCGHFPEGTDEFTPEEEAAETRGGWYVRQILGSANLDGDPSTPPVHSRPAPPVAPLTRTRRFFPSRLRELLHRQPQHRRDVPLLGRGVLQLLQ